MPVQGKRVKERSSFSEAVVLSRTDQDEITAHATAFTAV